MERSGARGRGAGTERGGGYRIRLERGAAFSPAPLRSHALDCNQYRQHSDSADLRHAKLWKMPYLVILNAYGLLIFIAGWTVMSSAIEQLQTAADHGGKVCECGLFFAR